MRRTSPASAPTFSASCAVSISSSVSSVVYCSFNLRNLRNLRIGTKSADKRAHSKMSPYELWRFLPIGYLFTILIETPVLLAGLSRRHAIKRRLLAGVWLTACTYPIVVLVLPPIFANSSRALYLVVAEVFAPVAECILFWLAYGDSELLGTGSMWQDMAAIVLANLASFLGGEVLNAFGWFGLV